MAIKEPGSKNQTNLMKVAHLKQVPLSQQFLLTFKWSDRRVWKIWEMKKQEDQLSGHLSIPKAIGIIQIEAM